MATSCVKLGCYQYFHLAVDDTCQMFVGFSQKIFTMLRKPNFQNRQFPGKMKQFLQKGTGSDFRFPFP